MKCAHTLCTCDALPGQRYCCDQCQLDEEREERGERTTLECQCLHADCANIPARIEETPLLLEDIPPELSPA